jgi:hypothetical protein
MEFMSMNETTGEPIGRIYHFPRTSECFKVGACGCMVRFDTRPCARVGSCVRVAA